MTTDEELSELRELIKEKEALIAKYPDTFSLKIGLMSLRNREKELMRVL